MTTAIAVYDSDGLVGRCDATCHNAKEPTCRCICGGRLHGVGAENAVEQNTRDMLGEDAVIALREFAEARGLDPTDLTVALDPAAMSDAVRRINRNPATNLWEDEPPQDQLRVSG
jgi:hypothetical protein